ncbi:hypothetical protein K435DRAFT_808361 [Dendrothele bispora CBS 962.96]|uniref:Uncharacterized protein n=1 Tax=Dendrothele bispora (strain CBS 962.96) TaxID=1314807 RepID=A0A4S8L1R7_DENBC|nr:hypothetical protein K435DRAFT_808361 [Dendrothele bispora CBS 962.96]
MFGDKAELSNNNYITINDVLTFLAQHRGVHRVTTTARPSNLQGEPSVVIYRKPAQQPAVETPREPTPKPLEDKPDEDKSREDAATLDDPLALRRTPRAAARTKEALDIQVNNSRKRPRESSPEVDDDYKNSNAASSDEEALAVATKRQRQSRDTTTSSKASSSKDTGLSRKTSTTKTAAGGSSKKTTAKQDANKKKPAVKKARTPAPSKIDKGKRKAVSENPESEEVDAEPLKAKPDYDLPGKVVNSAFLRGRMALVTADFKKLETPPGFSGLETLPYLTPAEYIANDTQNTRLFPSRPGRAASTNEKDYPDVFIASHRLGAGYSVKDLVETTRNIGAVRQIVADHKPVLTPKLVFQWAWVFPVSLVAVPGSHALSIPNSIDLKLAARLGNLLGSDSDHAMEPAPLSLENTTDTRNQEPSVGDSDYESSS